MGAIKIRQPQDGIFTWPDVQVLAGTQKKNVVLQSPLEYVTLP
jgi:hypothetical protein